MSYGGRGLSVSSWLNRGRSVVVCNEQEFHTAAQEKRSPTGVGFPKKGRGPDRCVTVPTPKAWGDSLTGETILG
jgi:hypothetical protein